MQKRDRNPAPLPDFAPVPRKHKRHDGWTPARQRDFIEALADTGSVKGAARRVGMASEGAYALRRQPGAEAFAAAWEAALDHGIRQIEDALLDRALNGVEVPVYSYGKLVTKRTVYNDRLGMFMLRNRAADRFAAGASGRRINVDAQIKDAVAAARQEWIEQQEKEQEGLEERVQAHMDMVRERLRQRALTSPEEGEEGF